MEHFERRRLVDDALLFPGGLAGGAELPRGGGGGEPLVGVVERQGGEGALSKRSEFRTLHKVDNIELGSDGALYAGTVPLPYTSRVVCDEAAELAATKVVDGREVGCGKAPGGALRIDLASHDGGKAGAQAQLAMHDGSLLSGVASALQLGDKVAMGSPDSTGVLLCDM